MVMQQWNDSELWETSPSDPQVNSLTALRLLCFQMCSCSHSNATSKCAHSRELSTQCNGVHSSGTQTTLQCAPMHLSHLALPLFGMNSLFRPNTANKSYCIDLFTLAYTTTCGFASWSQSLLSLISRLSL